MVEVRWTTLGKEKLASSGLNTKIAEQLGMKESPSAALMHPAFDPLPALVMPYYDVNGKPCRAKPTYPDFYRIRYLAKGNSIKDLATNKSQRYAQPPKTGVCAYFPKIINWKEISADTSEAIFITEGELKAAAACTYDFATIGLGGVWNFRMASEGCFFLPELAAIDWRQRDVFIVYDSDYIEKPAVCQAINAIAEELSERGALVKVILLPDALENGKTGLDDYFLHHTPTDFEALVDQALSITISKSLWKMNKEVIYVEDPGLIVVTATGQKMSAAQFKEHSRWAAENTAEGRLDKEGNLIIKKVAAAPIWIRWPMRQAVRKVTYAPGQDKITDDNEYNQWPGWGADPEKGNVQPWIDLTKHIFSNAEPEALEYFYDWCAYPIQHPGTKMFVACVVHGVENGTGKSLLGYTLGEIYGKNFKELTDKDLENGYTAWAENKQFVMGDEISGSDNRQYANMLKRLITQRNITINIKFVPQYDIPDCINYFFTSNHADAFFLEDKDRRFFVTEVKARALDEKFYKTYDDWLWRKGGPAALHHWLKNRRISKTFNPFAPAMTTSAKERMINAGRSELSAWIYDLLTFPDQVLVTGQMTHVRDMFTTSELLSFMRHNNPDTRVTSVGLGRALANAGVPQALDGAPLRDASGKLNRHYIVRNVDKWVKEKNRKRLEAEISKGPVKR